MFTQRYRVPKKGDGKTMETAWRPDYEGVIVKNFKVISEDEMFVVDVYGSENLHNQLIQMFETV